MYRRRDVQLFLIFKHVLGLDKQDLTKKNSNSLSSLKCVSILVKVIPRSEGLFTVMVHDVCLDSTGPAVVNVQVSDIYGVHIDVVDKVCDMRRCRGLVNREGLKIHLLIIMHVNVYLSTMVGKSNATNYLCFTSEVSKPICSSLKLCCCFSLPLPKHC